MPLYFLHLHHLLLLLLRGTGKRRKRSPKVRNVELNLHLLSLLALDTPPPSKKRKSISSLGQDIKALTAVVAKQSTMIENDRAYFRASLRDVENKLSSQPHQTSAPQPGPSRAPMRTASPINPDLEESDHEDLGPHDQLFSRPAPCDSDNESHEAQHHEYNHLTFDHDDNEEGNVQEQEDPYADMGHVSNLPLIRNLRSCH